MAKRTPTGEENHDLDSRDCAEAGLRLTATRYRKTAPEPSNCPRPNTALKLVSRSHWKETDGNVLFSEPLKVLNNFGYFGTKRH